MTLLRHLTGRRVLLASIGWVIFVVAGHALSIWWAMNQFERTSSGGGLSAIGFGLRGLLLQLLIPPFALVSLWLAGGRSSSSPSAT